MADIQLYTNEKFGEIRTTVIDGEPWFVGKDVALALGYADTKSALADHVDGEDKTLIQRGKNATFEIPNRGLTFINESGLYSLVLSSKLPSAKAFKRWITHEVIPSIRKHGAYITPNVVDQMIASPEFGIQLLTALKEERKKTAALQYENEQMLPKADYYDSFIHADASLSNFRDTAKQIGLPERAFINLLLDSEYIYRTTGRTREFRPNANKNAGYFVLKDFQASTGHVGKRTMITPQGKAHFSKIYRNIIEDFRNNGKAIFKGGKNQ